MHFSGDFYLPALCRTIFYLPVREADMSTSQTSSDLTGAISAVVPRGCEGSYDSHREASPDDRQTMASSNVANHQYQTASPG